jgi:hypothetical protein
MGVALSNGRGGGAIRLDDGRAAAPGAVSWLCLAAAPTFAIMALVSGLHSGSQHDILCAAGDHASPLSGMVPMYLLMSAFHSPPWLRFISRRRNGARR